MKSKFPAVAGLLVGLIISSMIMGGIISLKNSHSKKQSEVSIDNFFSSYNLTELYFDPLIVPTEIEEGLSNVELQGLGEYLTEEMIEHLENYGFVLKEANRSDIYYYYDYEWFLGFPMYITTDLCLHSLHSIFDKCLRLLEYYQFESNFTLMISELRKSQIAFYQLYKDDSSLKDIFENNIAYLSVILTLLDNQTSIPSYVEEKVEIELENIYSESLAISAIFNYLEDFSQYKPRGHYTRSEKLSKYFQAMMYAGRMKFLLNDKTPLNELGVKHTKMALALVYSFLTEVKGKNIWDYWDRIVQTTSFLIGIADDLTPREYYNVWKQVTNKKIDISSLSNDELVKKIIKKLQELRAPKINSRITDAFEGEESAEKGMSLFGQSYTPDAYIFQELVFDNLPTRMFPKGLDIFSVFGSERAEHHLETEKEYEGYTEKINLLREEFSELPVSNWTQNIYWQWLYTLLPLLEKKGEGYPGYMQSDAWSDKSLMTALASWVQLKHDTLLYGKAGITLFGIPDPVYNYVEPYPKVYSRLASTLSSLKVGLELRGLLDFDKNNDFRAKFDKLINIFNNLTEISIKELENQPITKKEQTLLMKLGKELSMITMISEPDGDEISSNTDRQPSVIADVFTEINSGQVLEVAVGKPFLIYVIVQDHRGKLYLTRGVTFSYYEFKQSMNNRLTDEEWQEILETSPPELPKWIQENLPIVNNSEEHLYNGLQSKGTITPNKNVLLSILLIESDNLVLSTYISVKTSTTSNVNRTRAKRFISSFNSKTLPFR